MQIPNDEYVRDPEELLRARSQMKKIKESMQFKRIKDSYDEKKKAQAYAKQMFPELKSLQF